MPQSKITALTLEGLGVSRVEGKVYFVEGGLPGETVAFEVTHNQARYSKAIMRHIIGPASKYRIESDCEYFNHCGGCSLRHYDQQAQLESKKQALLEMLQRIGQCQPQTVMPSIESKRLHYRRKARLSVDFDYASRQIDIGFKSKYNHNVVSIDSCNVLHESIEQLILPLKAFLTNLSIKRDIQEVEVAQAEAQIGLVLKSQSNLSKRDVQLIEMFAQQHNLQIFLQLKSRKIFTPIWPLQPPPLYYSLADYKLRLNFSVTDFIQVNDQVNQLMVAKIVELIEPEKDQKILDLYCGLGNFTLPLALSACDILGVDGDRGLIEKARANANLNKIQNVQFRHQNLALKNADYSWLKAGFEKVLLDPARSGAQVIIDRLGQVKPQRIVYVSCDPATLARDAYSLVNKYGYDFKKLGVVDQFPDTSHLESIAVFE